MHSQLVNVLTTFLFFNILFLMNKVAFIGHRNVLDISLREKLYKVVEKQILDGNYCFIMGTHGEFDKLALSVCIEQEHYKKRITTSNKKMIDESDILICYVDNQKSYGGAKTAFDYAQKIKLKTINLFEKLF